MAAPTGRLWRRALIGIAALAGVLVLALVGGAAWLYSTADVSTVGRLEFDNRLKVPPVLEPRTDDAGRKVFDLELQAGVSELLPGKRTQTWGANGAYLAPTLRAARGDRVRVDVENGLPEETTTIHWHGMHLPARADGGPHQMIEPGETWSPEWTIDQPAATLWYHPHLHPETADQVYRGITGMFLLDDPKAAGLSLPDDYGVDDVPLIIQDKKLEGDGSLDFSKRPISPTGVLGDEILVNGTHDPYLEVTTERVRLRLLNASNARVYDIGFSDDRRFELIATDGGLLDAPARLDRVQLSPGERAEIVAELDPGERVVLRSFEPDLGTNFWDGRFSGADDSFDLLELRAADDLARSPELPGRLVPRARADAGEARRVRRFELSGQGSINGREMDMTRIDQAVRVDTSEIWEVENGSGTPHNFHIHDVRFRVLEYADEDPPEHLRGLKDTVYIPPNETARLLVEFNDYTDSRLPYMFHCHVLQHEDRGMMGQFEVLEPGQRAQPSPPDSTGSHRGHRR